MTQIPIGRPSNENLPPVDTPLATQKLLRSRLERSLAQYKEFTKQAEEAIAILDGSPHAENVIDELLRRRVL